MNEPTQQDARVRESFAALRADRQQVWQQVRAGTFPEALWDAVVRTGAFHAVLTDHAAGAPGGVARASAALRELGAAGFLAYFPALTLVGSFCLDRHGTPELRSAVLRDVVAGNCRLCFAVTESRAGFNVLETATTARADGDDYVLDGEKSYVSGWNFAHEMLVIARTRSLAEVTDAGLPRTAGISLFLVPTGADGVVGEILPVRGEGIVRPHRVVMRGVRIARNRVVGAPNDGFAALAAGFNLERILMASSVLGASQFALATAVAHARERRVFQDQPIGAYQAIQHPLADVRVRIETLELLIDKAVRAFSGGAAIKDVEFLANAAKYLAHETGSKAIDSAIQTLGGLGFDERHGLVQMWECIRLLKLSPLSNELILSRIASQVLGLPRS
jgi:acyl-CoA dehydrogenase